MSRIKRGEHLAPQLLTWLAAAAGILTVGVVMTGCSLAPQEKRSIRVEIPRNTTIQEINASSKSDWVAQLPVPGFSAYSSYAPIPTNMAGIACLGMAVSAVDIADDPRVEKCPNEAVGKFAGLVSAVNGGSMEMLIAAGPARHVRIFGFSAIAGLGCPNMEDVLNNDSYKDSLGDPYLLAEQVVDLFEDKDIYLDAAFVSDRKLFQCGDKQDSVPLVIARKGRYPSPMNTSSPSAVYPTGPEGDGSFVGEPTAVNTSGTPLDFTAYEKGLILDFADLLTGAVGTSSNSILHSFTSQVIDGTSHDGRAAIRLAFDATGYEQLPYMHVSLRYSGGKANCSDPGDTSCGAAYSFLSDNSAGNLWSPLSNSTGSYLYWTSYSTLSDRHVVRFTDGKPYVLMNIESSALSTDVAVSQVIIEGVSVSLSSAPKPLQGQVSTGSGAMPSAGTIVNVPANQYSYVHGWGGVAPYTWSVTKENGSPGGGSCSGQVGCSGYMFTPYLPVGVDSELWTIVLDDTDASTLPYTFQVNVTRAQSTIAKFGVPGSVNTPLNSCVPFIVQAQDGAGNSAINNSGSSLEVSLEITGATGAFYTDSNCTSGTSSASIFNGNYNSSQMFFTLTGGTVGSSFSINLSSTTPVLSGSVTGVIDALPIVSFTNTNPIEDPCTTPVAITITNNSTTAKNITITANGNDGITGYFYSLAEVCSANQQIGTADYAISAPVGDSSATVYYKPIGNQFGTMNFYASSGGVSLADLSILYPPRGLKLAFSYVPTPLKVNTATGNFVINLLDPTNAPITSGFPHAPIEISIAADATVGFNSTTSTLAAGSSSATFSFTPTVSTPAVTFTATAAGMTAAQVSAPISPETGFTKLLMHSDADVSWNGRSISSTGSFESVLGGLFDYFKRSVDADAYYNVNNTALAAEDFVIGASDDFTIEMWVRLGGVMTTGQNIALVGNKYGWAGWELYLSGDTGVSFQSGNGVDATVGYLVGSDQVLWKDSVFIADWHHIAMIKSGSACGLFRDGYFLASVACPVIAKSSDFSIYVGANPDISMGFLAGTAFDEVRISKGLARYITTFPATAGEAAFSPVSTARFIVD